MFQLVGSPFHRKLLGNPLDSADCLVARGGRWESSEVHCGWWALNRYLKFLVASSFAFCRASLWLLADCFSSVCRLANCSASWNQTTESQ